MASAGPAAAPAAASTAGTRTLKLLVSVAGTLLGTWVAGQLDVPLDSGPSVQLAGAVLGALVPAVLGELLPSAEKRPAIALAIALVAVALTYISLTTAAYVTESPSRFPLPPGAPSPTGEIKETDGQLAIKVTPARLECSAHGCGEPVRVENAGDLPLRLDAIEVDGINAASFEPDPKGTCSHQILQESGDSCSFDVLFTPSGNGGTATARLVINQNLPDVPTYVPLSGGSGSGSGSGPEPATSPPIDEDPPEIHNPRFVAAGSNSGISRMCVGDHVQIAAEATDSTDITQFVISFSWITDATHDGSGGPAAMRYESGSTYRSATIDILVDGDYSFTIRATDASGHGRTAQATVGMLPGTTCGPIRPFSVSS